MLPVEGANGSVCGGDGGVGGCSGTNAGGDGGVGGCSGTNSESSGADDACGGGSRSRKGVVKEGGPGVGGLVRLLNGVENDGGAGAPTAGALGSPGGGGTMAAVKGGVGGVRGRASTAGGVGGVGGRSSKADVGKAAGGEVPEVECQTLAPIRRRAAEAPWPQSKEVSEAFEVAPPQWAAWGVLEDGRRKEMREEVLGMAPEAARQRWEARAAEAPWPPSSVPGEAEAPALVRGAALAMWPPCRTPVVEVEVDRHPVSQEEVEEGKALIRPAATPAGKAWPQSLGLAGEEAGRGPVLVESAPAWPALLDSLCCARSVHGYRLANYTVPG